MSVTILATGSVSGRIAAAEAEISRSQPVLPRARLPSTRVLADFPSAHDAACGKKCAMHARAPRSFRFSKPLTTILLSTSRTLRYEKCFMLQAAGMIDDFDDGVISTYIGCEHIRGAMMRLVAKITYASRMPSLLASHYRQK